MKTGKRNLWRYLSAGVLVLLLALVVFLLSAGSWLESESGRKLLQRELGKALGLQADLRGNYSLQLFPLIRIDGGELVLNDTASGLPILSADAYQLHLALRPLLRKEVNILKVAIHDGGLDLDRLTEFNSTRSSRSETESQLPRIRGLEISGLQLQKSGVDFLLVSELKLSDFSEDQRSGITLVLALDKDAAASETLHVHGFLQVTTRPLAVNLKVEGLSLHLQEKSWSLGEGELNWSADQQRFWGELRGFVATYSSLYELNVLLADGIEINLSGNLQAVNKDPIAVKLKARDVSSNWLLQVVDLNLAGQRMAGTGCLSIQAPPLLQLQLEAVRLDLDALQGLLPEGLFSASPTAEGEAPAPPVAGDLKLPLRLAVALSAEQLIWSETTASGVKLLIGAEPDCTSIAGSLLN